VKARYKLLIVIILLWLGMTYEGSRNTTGGAGNSQNATTLQEEIRAYEGRVASGIDDHPRRSQAGSTTYENEDFSGNFFSRLGRNVGRFLQTAVRETLRAFVRFFDGVIS